MDCSTLGCIFLKVCYLFHLDYAIMSPNLEYSVQFEPFSILATDAYCRTKKYFLHVYLNGTNENI
jgi:hypothetical protein